MSTITNLPASIQVAIQQGFLEREFRDPLVAKLAFRSVADRERFPNAVGESYMKTRTGLLPTVTTPFNTPANTDLDNGLTDQNIVVEQYLMTLKQYAGTMSLNLINAPVAIADLYLQYAKTLGEQAARSIEQLARDALYNTFMGQNTFVKTTLGSPGTTVAVDDIRGFGVSWDANKVPTTVSSSNPLSVTFVVAGAYSDGTASTNTTGGTYNCIGVTADGTNVSTVPGGISGTLTFSSNVTVADATAGNAVVAAVAPVVIRANNRASSKQIGLGDTLTTQMVLQAKAQLEANNVPPFDNGYYRMIVDPYMALPLYQDTAFQRFTMGHSDGEMFLKGRIGEILGVELVVSNMNQIQTGSGFNISRGIVMGKGVLVESDYTETGYDNLRNELENELITMVDGIAHITRPPLDRLAQSIMTSWTWLGGFVAPTDINTTTTTIPTANNSAWKRGVLIEASTK